MNPGCSNDLMIPERLDGFSHKTAASSTTTIVLARVVHGPVPEEKAPSGARGFSGVRLGKGVSVRPNTFCRRPVAGPIIMTGPFGEEGAASWVGGSAIGMSGKDDWQAGSVAAWPRQYTVRGAREFDSCPRFSAPFEALFVKVFGTRAKQVFWLPWVTRWSVSVPPNTAFRYPGAAPMMCPNPMREERHHGMAAAQSE